MRTEKKKAWGDPKEHLNVYSWDLLDYVLDVDDSGLVMIRDLDGHPIQATHLLQLVNTAKVVDHYIGKAKLEDTKQAILAEISTQ